MIWHQQTAKRSISDPVMTAKQQLDAIYRAVSPLYKERDKTYAEIKKQLSPYGVCGLDFKELEQQEKKFVKKYFKEEVMRAAFPTDRRCEPSVPTSVK